MPNPHSGNPDVGPWDAHLIMDFRKVPEINAVLREFDDVHVHLARIILAAKHEPPVVDPWFGRKPVGRLSVRARRAVHHDHAVMVNNLPVPVGVAQSLGVGAVEHAAASVKLPAVKGALDSVSLNRSVGQVCAQVRAECVHRRDPAVRPAAKEGDLLPGALNVPHLPRTDVP